MTWQFSLTGLLIGVLVGLTGMGGGALLTPILVLRSTSTGIWISSRFTLHLPRDALRLALAGVLALSGIKLLDVPQSSYVIAVGLGLGLAAFAVWLAVEFRGREPERADSPRTRFADGDGDGFRGDAALEARAEPDLADARR